MSRRWRYYHAVGAMADYRNLTVIFILHFHDQVSTSERLYIIGRYSDLPASCTLSVGPAFLVTLYIAAKFR